MTPELLIKSFFLGLISCILAWAVFVGHERELGEDPEGRQRYMPIIPALLLPIMLDVLILMALPDYGLKRTAEMVMSFSFGIFLHISLYYLVLLLVMPLLRKWISARACALLWIIPNYLYVVVHSEMAFSEPLLVIRVESGLLWVIGGIWLTGFVGVMVWKTVEHLIFRRRILRNARQITEAEILEVWQQELEEARVIKPKFRLMRSPDVTTPLSVGMFERTTRVVLPERAYTPEELALVLRHELVHICREDSSNKFFLLFCGAVCWFNPLMWTAMRRSADDLELSCDETVLLEAGDDTRQTYARLLLTTAQRDQGFTTSLSGSASALRYRLRHIVKPRKRRCGALVTGAVFFLLSMSCGFAALSYDAASGQEVIFDGVEPSACMVENINLFREEAWYAECRSDQELTAYLAGLSVSRLTGNYSFSNSAARMTIVLRGPKGAFGVNLWDRKLTVVPLYKDGESTEYYIDRPVDWQYVESLLELPGK